MIDITEDTAMIFALSFCSLFPFSIFTLLKKSEQYTDNFWETQAAFTQNNLCSRLKIFFKKPNVTESRKKAKNRNNFSFSFRHLEQAEKWICNSTRLLHHPTSGTPNLLTTGPSKQKLFVRFFLPQQRFLGKKLLTIEIRRKIIN